MNYLAPGSSYSSFLKAFKIQEQKGYFPYEFFDCADKLNCTSLPPFEDFYSTLLGRNVLDSQEEYNKLKKVWHENNMKCFKDFLVWYNNLDITPFVKAVVKLQKFYQDKNIDIFKSTISVPGITRHLVFKRARKEGAYFSLFDKNSSDIYFSLLSNIVGGPSIVFCRHSERNISKIRNKTKLCQKIVGYDANALYLWAFDQEFPVGSLLKEIENRNLNLI